MEMPRARELALIRDVEVVIKVLSIHIGKGICEDNCKLPLEGFSHHSLIASLYSVLGIILFKG
jgi:hypothetical protein